MTRYPNGSDSSSEFLTRGSEMAEDVFTSTEEGRRLRKPRGRRMKKPTRLDRSRKLHDVLMNLVPHLRNAGFEDVLPSPGSVALLAPAIDDPKTAGKIGHAHEPLGTYIQRLSVKDNFFQRPPFDHVTDPIYRRLIRDFIEGAAMPESKIAALSWTGEGRSLDAPDLRFSIIDGLQRLYCFLLAVLLLWRREQLVDDGLIPDEAWRFFATAVRRAGEASSATRSLLQRSIRYEVFYEISLAGLLHYMVTFNSSQRRMTLRVQLEIMKKPLIEHLKNEGIPIWEDLGKMPGEQRPKDKFLASDIVMATQAFVTHNPHVTTALETERFLDDNRPYLDNIGDITDVMTVLKRISSEVHAKTTEFYMEDTDRRFLITIGDPFLLGFAAACGYIRSRGTMEILNKALDKLLGEFDRRGSDPLNLESYEEALRILNAARGKDARRLVDDTFRRFFLGVTTELDWLDTADQITGGVSQ